jgi:hypothetical protein
MFIVTNNQSPEVCFTPAREVCIIYMTVLLTVEIKCTNVG